MISHEGTVELDTNLRKLFTEVSMGDYLVEYVLVASAMEPASGTMYSTVITPSDQRPPLTSGLIRLATVASDAILAESMEVFEDDDDDRGDD